MLIHHFHRHPPFRPALAALVLFAVAASSARAQAPAAPVPSEPVTTAPALATPPTPLPTPEPSVGLVVGDIKLNGLLSWKPEDILSRLKTKIGQPYNPLTLRDDVSHLAEIMRQVNVSNDPMEGDKIRLIFDLVEFPRLRKMQVIGNDKVSSERIDKLANLKPGDILEERAIKSLRTALIEEYRKMGLARAEVNINLVTVAPATDKDFEQTDLQIIIQEGEKIVVDDVKIDGSKIFSATRLRFLMKTKGSWAFIKNYYDDRTFEDDLVLLKEYYNQHGYFDARVERGAFEEQKVKGKIHVSPLAQITEGEKYSLGHVDVRGERLFSRGEILKPFKKLEGKEFTGKNFGEAMETAKNLYLDSGFLTTEIKPVNHFDPENRRVDVTLEIAEQNRIYVGDIKIERPHYADEANPGAFRRFYNRMAPPIKEEAIVREILLQPGEYYSKAKERESVRRLEQVGIFTDLKGKPTVSITNVPTANPRVHDVLVSLEEGPTGNYGGGVGFGDVQGAFIYAYLNERNLFGEAKDFRAQVSLGTSSTNATITYLDRHYDTTRDGYNVALGTSVFYSEYRRDGYVETQTGVTAELTNELYGGWQRSIRGRLGYVSLKERAGIDAAEDLNTGYPVATARLGFTNDTRSPARAPVAGRMLTGGVEAGYGGGPLLKFTGEGEYNYKLSDRFTYRFNPSFGLIPYDASSVGLSERLFLGGSEDLRGFRFRGAGLRDANENLVGVGGAVKLLTRNELIFPLVDPVSGVFFVDVGELGASPVSYEAPRASTGLGVRLAIQQATIAVDFALPFLKGSGDQTQFIHFSFKSRL